MTKQGTFIAHKVVKLSPKEAKTSVTIIDVITAARKPYKENVRARVFEQFCPEGSLSERMKKKMLDTRESGPEWLNCRDAKYILTQLSQL